MRTPHLVRAIPLPSARSFASLGLLAGTLCAFGVNAQQRWDVSSRDGLVTIMANAATAADLADAIGEATGIPVIVHGEASTQISADIVDEPLDKAIAQLAPNYMLVRDGKATDAEIIEVVLMMPDAESGSADSTEFLPSGAPAEEVITPEDETLTLDGAGNPDSQPDAQGGVDPSAVAAQPQAPDIVPNADGSVDQGAVPVPTQ